MLVVVLITTVLIAVVNSQKANLVGVPITIKPTISPPNVCTPVLLTAAVEEASLLERLNSGELAATEALQTVDSLITLRRRCEDGPLSIIHTVPNEFHWPPIYRGSCDNLFCIDPPCYVRKKIWRTRCVLVFQIINGVWRKIGYRSRRFIDHLSCGCKQCSDIREREWCINTKPCPNGNNFNSFCYWIPFIRPILPVIKADTSATVAPSLGEPVAPELETIDPPISPLPAGRCACCKPIYCRPPKIFNRNTCRCECPQIRCPPGRIFNITTCQCDCPSGSTLNSDGQCVGDCNDIKEQHCRFTTCRDNPHFQCQLENQKCSCPSCEAAAEPQWCSRTKCLEQSSKPHCVTDTYSNKCRCPRCSDQREREWCLNTYCGTDNSSQCKWESAWNRCLCPH